MGKFAGKAAGDFRAVAGGRGGDGVMNGRGDGIARSAPGRRRKGEGRRDNGKGRGREPAAFLNALVATELLNVTAEEVAEKERGGEDGSGEKKGGDELIGRRGRQVKRRKFESIGHGT